MPVYFSNKHKLNEYDLERDYNCFNSKPCKCSKSPETKSKDFMKFRAVKSGTSRFQYGYNFNANGACFIFSGPVFLSENQTSLPFNSTKKLNCGTKHKHSVQDSSFHSKRQSCNVHPCSYQAFDKCCRNDCSDKYSKSRSGEKTKICSRNCSSSSKCPKFTSGSRGCSKIEINCSKNCSCPRMRKCEKDPKKYVSCRLSFRLYGCESSKDCCAKENKYNFTSKSNERCEHCRRIHCRNSFKLDKSSKEHYVTADDRSCKNSFEQMHCDRRGSSVCDKRNCTCDHENCCSISKTLSVTKKIEKCNPTKPEEFISGCDSRMTSTRKETPDIIREAGCRSHISRHASRKHSFATAKHRSVAVG